LPKATRAVGTAVGKNPISFIIPCHRVIWKNAEFGCYGGGPARKKAILGWEAAHVGFLPDYLFVPGKNEFRCTAHIYSGRDLFLVVWVPFRTFIIIDWFV
jgi:hypothetical protein